MPDGNHIVVTLWDLLVTVNENCPRKAKMAKKLEIKTKNAKMAKNGQNQRRTARKDRKS